MIKRITLRNYMSHAHTVIDLAQGLTVLVGPNNCGKSAVVSALQTLCANASGAYMVRHEEREAQVIVETEDGHTFVWKRKGQTVSYTIDGQDIHRVNRSIPDNLHSLLKLPRVEAGEAGEPFDIHFGAQKSPIFLLNESENRAAVFFASSSDAGTLLEMQKRHRQRVKERRSDEKRLRAEIDKVEVELGTLQSLDVIAESISQTSFRYIELTESAQEIHDLEHRIEELNRRSLGHKGILRSASCFAGFKETSDKLVRAAMQLDELGTLNSTIAGLSTQIIARSRRDALHAITLRRHEALASLVPPSVELLDSSRMIFDLSSQIEVLKRRSLAREKFATNVACFADFQAIAARLVQETTLRREVENESRRLGDLTERIEERRVYDAQHRKAAQRYQVLASLPSPPVLLDSQMLDSLIGDLYREQENHQTRLSQVSWLEKLPALPDLSDTRSLESRLKSLAASIRDCAERSQTCHLLRKLTPPPSMTDTRPLTELLERLVSAVRKANTLKKVVSKTNADLYEFQQNIPTGLRTANYRGWGSRVGLRAAAGAGVLIVVTATLLLFSSAAKKTELAEDNRIAQKNGAQANETATTRPRDEDEQVHAKIDSSTASNESPDRADRRKSRLIHARKLLNEADQAAAKGRHLDAVLAYGQAAILYPNEMAEVDDPARLKVKFVEALKRYQREVEQAFDRATEPDQKKR